MEANRFLISLANCHIVRVLAKLAIFRFFSRIFQTLLYFFDD